MKLTLDNFELQMKSRKKVFGICNGSFLNSLDGRGHGFLISLKGAVLKKVWEFLV